MRYSKQGSKSWSNNPEANIYEKDQAAFFCPEHTSGWGQCYWVCCWVSCFCSWHIPPSQAHLLLRSDKALIVLAGCSFEAPWWGSLKGDPFKWDSMAAWCLGVTSECWVRSCLIVCSWSVIFLSNVCIWACKRSLCHVVYLRHVLAGTPDVPLPSQGSCQSEDMTNKQVWSLQAIEFTWVELFF